MSKIVFFFVIFNRLSCQINLTDHSQFISINLRNSAICSTYRVTYDIIYTYIEFRIILRSVTFLKLTNVQQTR